jgi:hypothetical protein
MMNISRKDSVKQGIGLIRVFTVRTGYPQREHSDVGALNQRGVATDIYVTAGAG